MTTKIYPRGLIPSSRSDLAAATPHKADPKLSAGLAVLNWPLGMSFWGNDVYGDCVTAEEAFAKATVSNSSLIPTNGQQVFSDATVLSWAVANGTRDGSTPVVVMQLMQKGGFPLTNQIYDDGAYYSVDWTNSATIQSALQTYGVVKLGVAADYFQSSPNGEVTPGISGWALYNYPKDATSDHCVSLCGYASTLAEMVALFQTHGITVNVPAGMPIGPCYAIFTWNSIGVIDEQSMLNMTSEAWGRSPLTSFTSISVGQTFWETIVNYFKSWFSWL